MEGINFVVLLGLLGLFYFLIPLIFTPLIKSLKGLGTLKDNMGICSYALGFSTFILGAGILVLLIGFIWLHFCGIEKTWGTPGQLLNFLIFIAGWYMYIIYQKALFYWNEISDLSSYILSCIPASIFILIFFLSPIVSKMIFNLAKF